MILQDGQLKDFLLHQSLAVRTTVLPEVREVVDSLKPDYDSVKQYKTDIGYKIPISVLDNIRFNKNKLDIIRVNTKLFEGRLIIEDNICIIEHPNIYNKSNQ